MNTHVPETVRIPTLSLLHHVYDGRKETSAADYAAGWSVGVIHGAPEITSVMEAALRPRLTDMSTREHHNVTWHHCDGNAWAAVTDLHRAGEHDEATNLARLLRWCDQQFAGRVSGIWEIAGGDPR